MPHYSNSTTHELLMSTEQLLNEKIQSETMNHPTPETKVRFTIQFMANLLDVLVNKGVITPGELLIITGSELTYEVV